MTDFFKYQALGNDYVVIDPRCTDVPVSPESVRLVCDRHFGIGADGVLHGPLEEPRPGVPVPLALFNSDGSVCERSGNGLRMFALHLAEREPERWAGGAPFTLRTAAGDSPVQILDRAAGVVRVGLGKPTFDAAALPLLNEDGSPAEGPTLSVPLTVGERKLTVTALHNGNPHTVVPVAEPTAQLARTLGPEIAGHARFPLRTNVQFLRVVSRGVLEIEVYERGAGYALASGSSACAAASAARELGLCDDQMEVRMPGGSVTVTLAPDGSVTLTGDAHQVASGVFAPPLRALLDHVGETGR
ncbi:MULTISPECIES: diaminopimelate epimerase [unclassified Streptomyces]|uniref:diaminopimelate epimerase n=1 Tax=unclassified Streptomyces TaxID=2593676 RepID=UPI001371D7B8|nr:diaminopimelate epimerase [Streptomyces sp. YIM 132580]MXG28952.1 diaminopimelate epimerase [Streptomyces sp. YIM 132580]